MIMSLISVAHILALIAPEYNCRAITLMLEYICIGLDLFAAPISVAALEFDFSKQVSGDTIDLIKLRIRTTERAVIRVFCKPVTLAVRANRFLADLTFQGVLEYIIADAANQLGEKRSHICLILNVVFFVDVACARRWRLCT